MLFVVTASAGFILFLIAGYIALNLVRGNTALAIAYLMLSFVVAILCCLKQGLRGLGVGILLGLGAVLLLLAVCSGVRF